MNKYFSIFLLSTLPCFAEAGKVLVVLSGENTLKLKNGKTHETGFYLNELTIPLQAIIDAGYEPVFATPNGKLPSMDARSDSATYFQENQNSYQAAKNLIEKTGILKNKSSVIALKNLKEKDLAGFQGIFVPGGHAPMIDLHQSKELGKILNQAHKYGMPTALICHGPVALLSTKKAKKKDWPYLGYRMTVFGTAEEKVAEEKALHGKVAFYPDAALKNAGGRMEIGPAFQSHIVEDRELLTAQNPASDLAFTESFLRKLKAYSSESAYHRFYQGYVKSDFPLSQFPEKMNQDFFPLFPKASKEGLIAYRAALPKSAKKCHLPNEIAFLSFENEVIYQKYKDSEIGKKIGDAHKGVFDPEKSKSMVPEIFEGKIEADHAYRMKPEFRNWSDQESGLLIFCGPMKNWTATQKALESIYKKDAKVPEIVTSISQDRVVEVVFSSPKKIQDRKKAFSKLFKSVDFIPLKRSSIGQEKVKLGMGIQANLETDQKSLQP